MGRGQVPRLNVVAPTQPRSSVTVTVNVVGPPLTANQPIFGREAVFANLRDQLSKFTSASIQGDRRTGKSSVINHLLGNPTVTPTSPPGDPPLLLAHLDLQAYIITPRHFYGAAIRTLLDALPSSRSQEAHWFAELRRTLHEQGRPEADDGQFEMVLRRLGDSHGLQLRPVLVVDEFERLLRPNEDGSFPFNNDFFDGLRSQLTATRLAMVVACREPLSSYFNNPARPNSLTSTFPSYLPPTVTRPLTREESDALLLQANDFPLRPHQAAQAWAWCAGHPCHSQAAGQAFYEANRDGSDAKQRFALLQAEACHAGTTHPPRISAPTAAPDNVDPPGMIAVLWQWLKRGLAALFVGFPVRLGRAVKWVGERLDDLSAWLIGIAIIVLVILLLVGVANATDLYTIIKRALDLP